jgi:nitrite reductase (NO-forming)
MKTLTAGLVALALLAACGGSGSSQPAGSTQVTMTEFKFDPSSITVTHGKVTFWLVNSGSTSHDMVIRDDKGNRLASSELISAGDSRAFTVDNLPAGSYTFFCSQPGHEASGMKGTLSVT